MCENCRNNQRKLMEEIAELASGEGELYEQMKSIVFELHDSDELREHVLTVEISKAIAMRAAFIARFTDVDLTEEGGLPPSIILGLWAGWAMTVEADAAQRERVHHALANFFGMGMN